MAIVTIQYQLTEEGRRASLLAGGDGCLHQSIEAEATPGLLDVAAVSHDGRAVIDLHRPVKGPRRAYAHQVTARDGTGALASAPEITTRKPFDHPLTVGEAQSQALYLTPAPETICRIEEERIREAVNKAIADETVAAQSYLAGNGGKPSRPQLLNGTLRDQVEARARKLQEQADAKKAAEQRLKAEKEKIRRKTLGHVVQQHMPDLLQAWQDGELCEREPATLALETIQQIADKMIPGEQLPEHTGTMRRCEADCLPADALRARRDIRAKLDEVLHAIADAFGLDRDDVSINDETTEWVTPYRPATEDEKEEAYEGNKDLENRIDEDGDLRLPRRLRLQLSIDAGGLGAIVERVLVTKG